MADHTANPDWVDCRTLRAAEETAGEWGRRAGLNPAAPGASVWQGGLRLIEPSNGADRAVTRLRAEAAARAREQAEEAVRIKAEAAAKARVEADRAARQRAAEEAEARAKAAEAVAAAKAKADAEKRARAATEAKARTEALARARAEAEARKQAEALARARARAEAEEKARTLAEARAKAQAEVRARRAAEAVARAAAEDLARQETAAKARAIAQAEAEAAARAAAEEQARKEAKSKAKAEQKARLAAEAKAAEAVAAQEHARIAAEAESAAQAAAAEEQARRDADAKAAAQSAAAATEAAARASADLGQSFRRLIRETGPISLARYMGESNARYYASRDPLGDQGDFITAPEITQMFGELIGLWLADLWVRMGSRKYIHYVELGPGRGTLAKDALTTAARYDFAPQVHFVETSPTLRRLQRDAFPDCHHHHDLATLPDDAPLLIVANEFFDALPVHQLVRSADGWFERMVGLDGESFVYAPGRERMDALVPPSWLSASQGAMIETSPAAVAMMGEIAQRLRDQGGAALIIDYGPLELRAGATLQALKAHQKVDVFAHPGEADLTAHVDFELLAHVARQHGADVMGVQMQGEWLRQMGIDTRTEALQRRNPHEADKLKRQRDRLVEDNQMGTLFKVLGLCGRRWPFGVGFD